MKRRPGISLHDIVQNRPDEFPRREVFRRRSLGEDAKRDGCRVLGRGILDGAAEDGKLKGPEVPGKRGEKLAELGAQHPRFFRDVEAGEIIGRFGLVAT